MMIIHLVAGHLPHLDEATIQARHLFVPGDDDDDDGDDDYDVDVDFNVDYNVDY